MAQDSCHLMNLADIRRRGTESVSTSSRAAVETGADETVRQRDGPFCVFTSFPEIEKTHLIPHRVQSKVCALITA